VTGSVYWNVKKNFTNGETFSQLQDSNQKSLKFEEIPCGSVQQIIRLARIALDFGF